MISYFLFFSFRMSIDIVISFWFKPEADLVSRFRYSIFVELSYSINRKVTEQRERRTSIISAKKKNWKIRHFELRKIQSMILKIGSKLFLLNIQFRHQSFIL